MATTTETSGATMAGEQDWIEWRGAVDQRLDAVEQRLDRVEQRLDRVEQRLDQLEQQVADLTVKIVALSRDVRWGASLILLILAAQTGASLAR